MIIQALLAMSMFLVVVIAAFARGDRLFCSVNRTVMLDPIVRDLHIRPRRHAMNKQRSARTDSSA